MVKYYCDWSVFMYKKKNRAKQHQMQFITLDDIVPSDHILRLIDDAIDFSFMIQIYLRKYFIIYYRMP